MTLKHRQMAVFFLQTQKKQTVTNYLVTVAPFLPAIRKLIVPLNAHWAEFIRQPLQRRLRM
jgi:hypothetical protein